MYRTIVLLYLFVSLLSASWVQDFDNSVYKQINSRWQCGFSDAYFPVVSRIGGGEIYIATDAGFFFFGNEKMKNSAKLSTVGLALTMLTTQGLKYAVGRQRPENSNSSRWDSSFPSGHTAAAFTMAYIYGSQYPKSRIPLYAFAVSVGLARIYLGEHYPTDVIAGAAIGTIGGIVVMKNKKFVLSIGL
ncbi:phosphatase PAP2 family protein [bacterium]|nr:phosphatase PAP2 family protein [bacterium]